MTERERLIELLKKSDNKLSEYIRENDTMDYIPTRDELFGVSADYLLANGVIVPPVRIGQKVYRTSGNFRGEKIYEGVVDQINAYDDRETRFYVYGHPLSFVECNIGKTVFLTKEKALQALKGGAE